MTEDPRRALGRTGEERAARLLAELGFAVLARNVRAGGVEIDLVAARGALVVFVEVKTRHAGPGAPEEAVGFAKRARLARGAAAWLAESRRRYARVRFDVVTCEVDGATWRVRHWPGAFDAGE
jgi:putative endonuclease